MLKWSLTVCLLCLAVLPAMAQDSIDLLSPPQLKPLFFDQADPERKDIKPGSIRLSRTEIDNLLLSRRGSVMNLPNVDKFLGNQGKPLEFRRVVLMAPGARVYLMTEDGQSEFTPPERHFYLATSKESSVGVAVDPNAGNVSGVINHKGQHLKVGGNFTTALEVTEISDTDTGPSSCGNSEISMGDMVQSSQSTLSMPSASAAASGSTISYQAVVAIDTDNEWMDRFDDDETEAMTWIEDMFVEMNAFFERDVELQLLIGDVFLNVLEDNYTETGGSSAQLDEFAEYWRLNRGGVDRTFTTMLSGRIDPGYSFSGIAWLTQYCKTGTVYGTRTVGSYNYNAMSSGFSVSRAALFVGHEIGHNLGSGHTHCYSPPVDNCYNAQSGCYSGAVSCPASGKGTVMSYCHFRGSSGADCGESNKEIHPTVQATIEGHLASNLDSCIIPYIDPDPDPEPEFQASLANNALVELGDQDLGSEGSSALIQVSNLGDAPLTLACGLSGAQSASFNITACVAEIAPDGNSNLGVSCEPVQLGLNEAVLTVTTNDSDEGTVTYNLECNGTAPPAPEFVSTPGQGAVFDLGYIDVGEVSETEEISIQNMGSANLVVACSLLGDDAGSFNVASCPSVITPSGNSSVEVRCEPAQGGQLQATVRVSTNDVDEQDNDYSLQCTGKVPPPPDDMIFSDEFGG